MHLSLSQRLLNIRAYVISFPLSLIFLSCRIIAPRALMRWEVDEPQRSSSQRLKTKAQRMNTDKQRSTSEHSTSENSIFRSTNKSSTSLWLARILLQWAWITSTSSSPVDSLVQDPCGSTQVAHACTFNHLEKMSTIYHLEKRDQSTINYDKISMFLWVRDMNDYKELGILLEDMSIDKKLTNNGTR